MLTKDDAIRLGTELLALDVKARGFGSSAIDLLAILARNTYGIDVRPTAHEIDVASDAENEALAAGPEGHDYSADLASLAADGLARDEAAAAHTAELEAKVAALEAQVADLTAPPEPAADPKA